MIKVLLVDDHNMFRAGTQRVIEEDSTMRVSISTDSGKNAITLSKEDPPDLAVIDLSMPGMDGIECTDQLHRYFPKLPILILSMHEEPQYALRAFEAGASGYLTKRALSADLIDALMAIYKGLRYLPESLKEEIAIKTLEGFDTKNIVQSLSKREFQVLVLLAEGFTNREIAESYSISVKTVDTYRARILYKLDLRNNVDIAHFAFKNGLLQT
ncbi:MAG: response regulator transcription factor [Desulfobacteraceae bacterium]|nr:response regulator transcription factor [Desulfobacteraceae bacterium]